MIIWTEGLLKALDEATADAKQRADAVVVWRESRKKTHRWLATVAESIAARVRADLAAVPVAVFPENREGAEP